MILWKLMIKLIAFVLFCLISGYVSVVGKGATGIKVDYVITALILCLVMIKV